MKKEHEVNKAIYKENNPNQDHKNAPNSNSYIKKTIPSQRTFKETFMSSSNYYRRSHISDNENNVQ